MGDHLKQDCPKDPTTGTTIKWNDVDDQQIPDALQVQQSTGTASAATRLKLGVGLERMVMLVVWVGVAAGGGGGLVGGFRWEGGGRWG